jgi:uncharacterized protein (DUF302 family)
MSKDTVHRFRVLCRNIVTTFLFSYWMVNPLTATAQIPASVVTLESQYDFDTTVARLKQALTSHGITVFADIDQSAAAAQAGMTLRPTRLIMFGNPKAGTPIMNAYPHAALELPLKAVVWQDERRAVHVDYQDAATVVSVQYGVDPALTGALKQVPLLLRAVVTHE